MTQTAVELLIEQITSTYRMHLPNWEFPNKEYFIEMEKQQIEDAWYAGDEDGPIHDLEDYYNETYASKGSDVMTQEQQYSETLQRVMQHNAINDHLKLVNDCKDRMPALANELGADSYKVTWSIEAEDDTIVYNCSVGIQMPHHWMGSYVSASHPFEKAEAAIREMYAKYAQEAEKKRRRAEEERIKAALYDDYLAQKSSTKG